jgi:hypothetical protein
LKENRRANCAKIKTEGGEIVENERERDIRLSLEEVETLLRNAKLIETDETLYRAWIEPGELVIKVLQ